MAKYRLVRFILNLIAASTVLCMPRSALPLALYGPSENSLIHLSYIEANQLAQTQVEKTQGAPFGDKTSPVVQDRIRGGRSGSITDWYIVWLTSIIAVVGFLQLTVFGLQARRLRQTIETMDDTAVRQLRAYVSAAVENELDIDRLGGIEIIIVIKNCGQTPAYNLINFGIAEMASYPFPKLRAAAVISKKVNSGSEVPRLVLHPGASIRTTHLCELQSEERDLIRHGKDCQLYVYGEISYKDAFDFTRYTRYRLRFGGQDIIRYRRMSWCDEGNEAT